MRQVETWQCTEAAATPTSDGARSVPWASSPWQVEQFVRNSASPVSISSWLAVWAVAGSEVTAEYATPVRIRARSRRTTGASRCLLLAASAFTVLCPCLALRVDGGRVADELRRRARGSR